MKERFDFLGGGNIDNSGIAIDVLIVIVICILAAGVLCWAAS